MYLSDYIFTVGFCNRISVLCSTYFSSSYQAWPMILVIKIIYDNGSVTKNISCLSASSKLLICWEEQGLEESLWDAPENFPQVSSHPPPSTHNSACQSAAQPPLLWYDPGVLTRYPRPITFQLPLFTCSCTTGTKSRTFVACKVFLPRLRSLGASAALALLVQQSRPIRASAFHSFCYPEANMVQKY